MSPNPSPMQQALFKAAINGNDKGIYKAVLKSADRIKVREDKPRIRLSYRTAMKLKAEGVLA